MIAMLVSIGLGALIGTAAGADLLVLGDATWEIEYFQMGRK